MPHKQAIIPYLSGMSDEARIMGAVNTFRVQNGGLFGYNTDAAGFISPLELAGHNIVNMRIVIIGAGGAARSAIFSLAQSGASEILVINRTVTRGVQLTREMQTAFSGCRLEFRPLSLKTLTGVSEEQVDILVNATSVGMEPNHADSLWPAYLPLPRRALCYDVIYKPLKTLFLQQAEATGHPILNGLEMLVHQGAVGFEIWTGHKVSVDTLTKACLKALDGRAH